MPTEGTIFEDEDAPQNSEEESGDEEPQDEGEGSPEGEEKPPPPDEQEQLFRLDAQIREAVQQALTLERQRIELAEASAKEEQRFKDIVSIEDEDERREKLAELGAETLKRREEEIARTRVRDEYARNLWADIQRVAPEIGQVFKDKAEELRSAKTDGELIVGALRALGSKDLAAKDARIKELEQALEAQRNATAGNKNRTPPVELPEGTASGGGAWGDIKDPIALMSVGFREADET